MPESIDRGTEQVMPRAALALLGQFLRQYAQQHQLTLITDLDLPTDSNGGDFWCLLGPDLSVVVTVHPQPPSQDADLGGVQTPAQNNCSGEASSENCVAVRLVADAVAVDDCLGHLGLADRYQTLAPTSLSALSHFMLAWVQVCAQAGGADAKPSAGEVDSRQQERRLLLNQVIAKIQGSLELPEILETTVAEVRQFLQADRLLIYQFEQPRVDTVIPMDAGSSTPDSPRLGSPATSDPPIAGPLEVVGYITYEARSRDRLASVLNYTEQLCFRQHPDYPKKHLRHRQGQPLAIDNVAQAYQHAPCMLKFLAQMEVKSKAVAPIIVGQQLWGLVIVHQCDTVRQWQPWEIEFLQHIAEHLAIAINQAQLYQQLQKQTQNLEVCVVERTQDLRDALVAAQAANRAKSEFLATMSHELRTPLTYIIGMSATLLRWSLGDLSPRQRDYLTTIQASGEQLLRVINDILDVSKIEAGRTVLEIRPFSLASLSRQTVDAFRSEATQNSIDINLDLKLANGQDTFVADPRRVRQILTNLLSNAIKFTPAEGKVTLRVRREPNDAVFQIEDTGIGIPAAAQALLFEKFQQLENVRQREHQGTGLGLALTKQLVELHGGTVKVASEVGVGSVFTVRIPLQRSAAPLATEASDTAEPLVGRIVLVEDNEETASLICDMLTAAAYQVIWIVDGSRVIDQVDLLQPAAVITSMTLASADGGDIIAALHQRTNGQKPRVLALLSDPDEALVKQALARGANACLAKPVDPRQLLTAVNAMMAPHLVQG